MRDPGEGVTPDGMITTGASRQHVAPAFEQLVEIAASRVAAVDPQATLYLYGSVATGQARLGRSDIDLLSIGLTAADAEDLGQTLTERFDELCRGVEISLARPADIVGQHDEAYGFRVFLRHYCVPLVGPDGYTPVCDYPADARAARGFNGDIAQHAQRWIGMLDAGNDLDQLARLAARKTLLAIAGLVSVHDRTWTTDRETAAQRWSAIEPDLADDLALLLGWADGTQAIDRRRVHQTLATTIPAIVQRFAALIGLWPDSFRPDGPDVRP